MNELRDLLHGLNNELSVAVMEIELLLESEGLDESARESLTRALDACRRAAVGVRQGWAVLGPPRAADWDEGQA